MNILITGADGMLGSTLVRLLLEKGHTVNCFIHPDSKSTSLDGLKVKKYFGDLLDPDSIEKALNNIDVVVHAAASTSVWPSRSALVRKINIDGTKNIIDKVLEHKISKLIYVGSASSVNMDNSADSKYSYPGEKYGFDYIDSKHEAFKMVMDSVEKKNLPATVILPTFMIGPYDSLPGSGKIVLSFAKGNVKFFTKGGRNFVHVKDVAEGIANSIDLQLLGRYFVVGNENLTYKAFFNQLAKILDRREVNTKVPKWIALTFGFLGDCFGKLFHVKPLVSFKMARISFEKQFVNCENSLNELGVTPTPVKTALEDCCRWFEENGYLN